MFISQKSNGLTLLKESIRHTALKKMNTKNKEKEYRDGDDDDVDLSKYSPKDYLKNSWDYINEDHDMGNEEYKNKNLVEEEVGRTAGTGIRGGGGGGGDTNIMDDTGYYEFEQDWPCISSGLMNAKPLVCMSYSM